MQLFNYHSHTKRCGHAKGEDEEYVKAAIANGYRVMGFSDHAPYRGVHMEGERMDYEELEDYISSVKYLQKKYEAQITIRIGLEFEYFEDRFDELRAYKDRFDYLLLGQHGPALYEPEFYDAHSDEDVLLYAQLIQKACAKGLPDIIVHPDLFMYGKEEFNDACRKASHVICQSAVNANIPLEINLNGLKHGKSYIGREYRYRYPYRGFWEIAQTYPIKVVYGLDAHEPQKYADKRCFQIVDKEILAYISLDTLEELEFERRL